MIYYFLILFYWLCLFSFGKKEITNTRLFFAILPLFLIMALKSVSVGCDTISYYIRYIGAVDMLDAENTITEPGFNMLSYFFHDILKVPFWLFYAVVSVFVCFVLGMLLRHFSTDIYLSLFIYMTIGLFTISMSGLRQIIAISLCMIPLIFHKVYEDTLAHSMWKRFCFVVLSIGLVFIAYTFHNSVIVFIPYLFLFDVRISKAGAYTLIILSILTLFFRDILIDLLGLFVLERYEKYNIHEGYVMNFLALMVPITIGLFCVLISHPEDNNYKYSRSLSTMFIFMASQIMFNNLALNHSQIARLGYYFMSSYVILIPYALKCMRTKNRHFSSLVIVCLCLLYFYLGTKGGTLRIDNYLFFWQEPIYLEN